MKNHPLFLFAGVLTCSLALLTGAYAAGKQKTFAIVPKSISISFYNDVEKGCKEEGAKLGVNVIYTGPDTADAAKQVQVLQDLVSRGGEKINCEEVEMAITAHPAVAAVAAVAYPDPVFDERLCAVLILREGCAAPTVAEMGAYLQQYGLAKFKWPEFLILVDEFPRTPSGKVRKQSLREQWSPTGGSV